MRRRILLIVFSCILLILSLVIFDRINARNAAPMPVPSVSGGYYENGFTLRLTAPSNGSIYYTTDGSTPTADSTLYQDGIPLKNRSSEQNLYNSVQNVVTDWKITRPIPSRWKRNGHSGSLRKRTGHCQRNPNADLLHRTPASGTGLYAVACF